MTEKKDILRTGIKRNIRNLNQTTQTKWLNKQEPVDRNLMNVNSIWMASSSLSSSALALQATDCCSALLGAELAPIH